MARQSRFQIVELAGVPLAIVQEPYAPYHHPDVIESFRFLVDEHGFTGPVLWNLAYEAEHLYFKDRIFLNVGYDGGFYYSIGKSREPIPMFPTGKRILAPIRLNAREEYDLRFLEPASTKLSNPSPEAMAQLLRKHSKVIEGDFAQFSLSARLWRAFKSFLQPRHAV